MTPSACIGCGVRLWRAATSGRTGVDTLLWPRPDSLCLRVKMTPDQIVVGVPLCPPCLLPIGSNLPTGGVVVGIERAPERYRYWYSDTYGRWLEAWLRDEMCMDESAQGTLLALWRQDRDEVVRHERTERTA